jgi:cobalt-zinc-cadmium efflux system protein
MHDHARAPAKGLQDSRLAVAVTLNVLLTAVEITGGVVSGSLALVADALHNFSDSGSLVIALVARRIARKKVDRRYTFGYRRAEVVAALVNLTALILVSLYLVGEAIWRWVSPRQIEGWVVVIVATVALAVDTATVLLLRAMSRGSLNVRAALLHNLGDAFSSLGVVLMGVCILLWDVYYVDALTTLVIAAYILWHSAKMIRQSIRILMETAPDDLDFDQLISQVRAVAGVRSLHHVHVWQLDERHKALEAHVVIDLRDGTNLEAIKSSIKRQLEVSFGIAHATLEFEFGGPRSRPPSHDTSVLPDH